MEEHHIAVQSYSLLVIHANLVNLAFEYPLSDMSEFLFGGMQLDKPLILPKGDSAKSLCKGQAERNENS